MNTKKKAIAYIIVGAIFSFGAILAYGYFQAPDLSAPSNASSEQGISTTGPRAEILPEEHDFGEVVYGDVARHDFTIRNAGDEPLEILQLSTSCGCTKASVPEDQMTVAPGASAVMTVTFDPAVHKDDSDVGEVTRIIYVRTNESGADEREARIFANVIKKQ